MYFQIHSLDIYKTVHTIVCYRWENFNSKFIVKFELFITTSSF
jgi:hypothetical protein